MTQNRCCNCYYVTANQKAEFYWNPIRARKFKFQNFAETACHPGGQLVAFLNFLFMATGSCGCAVESKGLKYCGLCSGDQRSAAAVLLSRICESRRGLNAKPDGQSIMPGRSAFVSVSLLTWRSPMKYCRLHVRLCCALADNSCTCQNGVAQTGVECSVDGAARCMSCNTGWTANLDRTQCIRKYWDMF